MAYQGERIEYVVSDLEVNKKHEKRVPVRSTARKMSRLIKELASDTQPNKYTRPLDPRAGGVYLTGVRQGRSWVVKGHGGTNVA